MRTARAATALTATVAVLAWMLTAGASYTLVSDFVHMRPTTTVSTSRPEVGVLVNAPANEVPALARAFSAAGIRVSFTLNQAPTQAEGSLFSYGDQAIPLLPTGGLVRWLQTRAQLHHLLSTMGFTHHFLYASNGPSVGQWWLAHGAGGRLIAGAVKLSDTDDSVGRLHAGELVQLSLLHADSAAVLMQKLQAELAAEHLQAVPVGQLIRDSGAAV